MIDIVSVHIPKTAGSSFRAMLEAAYGDRLSKDYRRYRNRFAEDPGAREKISSPYSAIHGHFAASKYLDLCPDAFFVTWLRHPVARLVSSYKGSLRSQPNADYPVRMKVLEGLSFAEFAEIDEVRGEVLNGYLKGFDMNRFDFVGITERFDEDAAYLSALLGWPAYAPSKKNAATNAFVVPKQERTHAERLLAEEIALYERFANADRKRYAARASRSAPV